MQHGQTSIAASTGRESCRSEPARDEPKNTARCQASSAIVDDHREQARSYR